MAEIRLIDANALKETMAEFIKNNIGIYSNEILYLIDNAPTIPLPDFKAGYKQAIIDGKTNFVIKNSGEKNE